MRHGIGIIASIWRCHMMNKFYCKNETHATLEPYSNIFQLYNHIQAEIIKLGAIMICSVFEVNQQSTTRSHPHCDPVLKMIFILLGTPHVSLITGNSLCWLKSNFNGVCKQRTYCKLTSFTTFYISCVALPQADSGHCTAYDRLILKYQRSLLLE